LPYCRHLSKGGPREEVAEWGKKGHLLGGRTCGSGIKKRDTNLRLLEKIEPWGSSGEGGIICITLRGDPPGGEKSQDIVSWSSLSVDEKRKKENQKKARFHGGGKGGTSQSCPRGRSSGPTGNGKRRSCYICGSESSAYFKKNSFDPEGKGENEGKKATVPAIILKGGKKRDWGKNESGEKRDRAFHFASKGKRKGR